MPTKTIRTHTHTSFKVEGLEIEEYCSSGSDGASQLANWPAAVLFALSEIETNTALPLPLRGTR